jgi:hypothetical protein
LSYLTKLFWSIIDKSQKAKENFENGLIDRMLLLAKLSEDNFLNEQNANA